MTFELGLIIVPVLLLLTLLFTLFSESIVKTDRFTRRPLQPVDDIHRALNRSSETGRAVHITPGAGPITNQPIGAESFAGLMLTQRLAQQAARRGGTMAASSGDAAAHLALHGMIRQAYQDAGYAEVHHSDDIQLFAHNDQMAFAAGQSGRFAAEPFEASIAVGSFGGSYLLIGAAGQSRRLNQIAGTVNPESLAAMVLTSDTVLMGEDVYAAEAYVAPTRSGLARLITHDVLRATIIVLLLLGLLLEGLSTAGYDLPLSF